MQYSPKLKTAMEQIKTILKENDIAGFIVLHTPGFSEYLNHIETSYSAAKMVNNGVQIKIETNVVGKEKAKQLATDTTNMFGHIATHIASHAIFYMDTEEILVKKYEAEDLPGGHTSHIQQNN